MHTIKRAVIMAAGKGERLMPLTKFIPKPLVRVNGVRMIDTIIDSLKANGINEIYVVVGHLKEQFYRLAADKGVTLIENPYYDTCNNVSSLYMAREHLEDCMILDGDQVIYDYTALTAEYESSGYNAVWTDEYSSEWLMTVEDGVVRSCSKLGGTHGWQLFSISRWTKEDGEKLRKHVEHEFESGNRSIYWDDIPMFLHSEEYRLGIKKMEKGDVVEIDSMMDLDAANKSRCY